jgi:hypothetical protein
MPGLREAAPAEVADDPQVIVECHTRVDCFKKCVVVPLHCLG